MERWLEEIDEVSADIVNVLLFDGERVVAPDDLVTVEPCYSYLTGREVREREYGVTKRWVKGGSVLRISCLGMESKEDAAGCMPIRVGSHDMEEYRMQTAERARGGSGGAHDGGYRPVVSLTLRFDTLGELGGPTTPHELLGDFDERLKPYVSDYKMNVFEIGMLDRETVDKFQSAFWYVADYFWQARNTGSYRGSKRELGHIKEVADMMSSVTGDERFARSFEGVKDKRSVRNMEEVLDLIEARGEARGIAQARSQLAAKVLRTRCPTSVAEHGRANTCLGPSR